MHSYKQQSKNSTAAGVHDAATSMASESTATASTVPTAITTAVEHRRQKERERLWQEERIEERRQNMHGVCNGGDSANFESQMLRQLELLLEPWL